MTIYGTSMTRRRCITGALASANGEKNHFTKHKKLTAAATSICMSIHAKANAVQGGFWVLSHNALSVLWVPEDTPLLTHGAHVPWAQNSTGKISKAASQLNVKPPSPGPNHSPCVPTKAAKSTLSNGTMWLGSYLKCTNFMQAFTIITLHLALDIKNKGIK